MKPQLEWLDDPTIFRVGQIPAHSDHCYYCNYDEMDAEVSSFKQNINGEWLFKFIDNPKNIPLNFYKPDYSYESFDTIKVPQHIEFAGYSQFHYINIMYSWEGKVQRLPAYTCGQTIPQGSFSNSDDNHVGIYIKKFDLNPHLVNKKVRIRFDGVATAMYVWLNGQFLGYAEDSFTPSEFDLTECIQEQGNTLVVEVFKLSSASFLEDQDFFQFFGIFRNVSLLAEPLAHIEDVDLQPRVSADLNLAHLQVGLRLNGDYNNKKVNLILYDQNKHIVTQKRDLFIKKNLIKCQLPAINNPHLWCNEDPYQYEIMIELLSLDNTILEVIPYKIGLRRLEIKNKIILLNNKRLIINGVNRHEWSATKGRAITKKEMNADMQIIQHNHINAVRTCHYPDQTFWYYLCDQAGIYVMSETNLESHGSWQNGDSWNVPGSIPQWREAVLDRARNNYELLKNHTSILFWSLGNESYVGSNLVAMNQYFKKVDSQRLTHYEGVSRNRSYATQISDIESRMYATPDELRAYLDNKPTKPVILCEYMHSMGNSVGGIDAYLQLLDQYPMYQGGFIWDFIDQAIEVTDPISGQKVLKYGGDFDDRPADYEFSGDGLLFANRCEKPAMQEVRGLYAKYK